MNIAFEYEQYVEAFYWHNCYIYLDLSMTQHLHIVSNGSMYSPTVQLFNTISSGFKGKLTPFVK